MSNIAATAAGSEGDRPERARVLLVSGLSGAGKTSALKVLEDLGWEVVDNLPLKLIDELLNPQSLTRESAIAVGIDSRTRQFSAEDFTRHAATLGRRDDIDCKILYFDCDDEVLNRRFMATRRRHPLAVDRPVMEGIASERALLREVQAHADHVIDSSALTLPELQRRLSDNFALVGRHDMHVTVLSFSYRQGVPRDADMVFDARFLNNPFYSESLRAKDGRDPEVAEFIRREAVLEEFMSGLKRFLLPLLPHYVRQGKTYLTIAVGCTGGQHRSVFVAGLISELLDEAGYRPRVRHRDLQV
ncbi:RNase adapter RapZ [Oceanibacterium hippocampi]|uniref:GlmZ(SRNA)-inactivating NTPase n=1 Tax=Oceanibacterium hippocampi TaxID=745714 RepID=A0A1Y5RP52_9PROT|nr:RNase adapter RapZ [Oceanibacterium hippocampi]SLN22113.1 glmZ(sRNA)-inactivating NTPase [Oceanibacterium hippocampi]